MIVVCTCGQKSRVRDLTSSNRLVCAKCRAPLAPEINRQAVRNANIVLDLAAHLLAKLDRLTPEETCIANLLHHHQEGR